MPGALYVMSYRARDAARVVARMPRFHRELDRAPGVVAGRLFASGNFWAPTMGYPTPRRYALLCGFEDEAARERFESSSLAASLVEPARERWRLALAPVRAKGQWRGWAPDVSEATPLAGDEPAAVITYGLVRARHYPSFALTNRRVIAASMEQPGLVMRMAIFDRPLSISTFSIWRRKGDALRFAYGPGGPHREVLEPWRKSWGSHDFFLRCRVLESSGTLAGHDPWAGVTPSLGPPHRNGDRSKHPRRD